MPSFTPRPEDLPDTIPVFPLPGALLLPRGKLPLNIFEPRYLAMTEDSLGDRRMFGMIQPDPRAPAGATGPGLYRIGCLGRLVSFSETDDGRYLITLLGITRFAAAEEVAMRRGYRRIRPDFTPFLADLDGPAPDATAIDRALLLKTLRPYFNQRGIQANWDAIQQMPDDQLVVTLGMVCPFDPAEKQALLEFPTPAERARTLLTLLQIDTHSAPADHPRAS